MTREEKQKAIDAVERLNALKQFIDYDKDSEIVKATQESLDMAIKALEQTEPEKCGDCISREAVKKILDNGWKSGVYPSAGSIDALPSVEPEQSQCSWYGEDGRCHFAEQEMDECDDCISRQAAIDGRMTND